LETLSVLLLRKIECYTYFRFAGLMSIYKVLVEIGLLLLVIEMIQIKIKEQMLRFG